MYVCVFQIWRTIFVSCVVWVNFSVCSMSLVRYHRWVPLTEQFMIYWCENLLNCILSRILKREQYCNLSNFECSIIKSNFKCARLRKLYDTVERINIFSHISYDKVNRTNYYCYYSKKNYGKWHEAILTL